MAKHASPDHHAQEHDQHPIRPLARLFTLFRPDKGDLWYIAIFAFGVSVLSLATPIAIELLVENVAFGVLLQPVIVLALILFVCLSIAAAMQAMQAFIVEYLQQRIFVRVVADFARRAPRIQLDTYDRVYGPDLMNRFFDVINVQKSAASLLVDGVAVVVSTLIGMVVLATYSWWLVGFDIGLLAAMAFLIFVLGRGGIRTSIHESHSKYETAAWLEELTRLPRTFRFGHGQEMAIAKADEMASEYVRCRRGHFRVVWRQILFALAMQVFASSIVLGLGGFLVITRQITLGQLVATELIVALVVGSFTKLGKQLASFYDVCTGVEKLGLITDADLEHDAGELPDVRGEGMLLRMHVRQPMIGREDELNLHWEILPNEKVGVTGPPGSGKSLVLDLICGFRRPYEGHVELDGIDLRDADLSVLRREIALVSGIDVLMGSVIDNLRLGRPEAPMMDVRTALEQVQLTEAIQELPDGLQTRLVPSGAPLSRTQALRLCIARALVARPRLLMVDNVLDQFRPTDYPDLYQVLFHPDAPWTLILVSNDPDLLMRCERVLSIVPEPEAIHVE